MEELIPKKVRISPAHKAIDRPRCDTKHLILDDVSYVFQGWNTGRGRLPNDCTV